MAGLDLNCFEPIFSRSELLSGGLQNAISARMFGNVVLVDQLDKLIHGGSLRNWILRRGENRDWDILASQFIDPESIATLKKNDARGFFASRSRLMYDRAGTLVGEIEPA
jgi:hypothetical protein